MSSRFPSLLAAAAFAAAATAAAAQERELRVCADPDDMPYSRADGAGFENRIAQVVAAEMGARLRYEWAPLKRGFVRKTIGAGLCDVLIGVPSAFERVATTRPYYRSSYVFVSRDAAAPLRSFDDPRLQRLNIGVQLVGDDLAATPAGHALAARGAVRHVMGFTVYGEGPSGERMVRAIERGALDAAVAWGPQVGYFAARAKPRLAVSVASAPAGLAVPFAFSISMGVKRGNRALRDELDAVLARRRQDIEAILDAYDVPRLPLEVAP